ncbi:tetratricopeptide repeat protein [Thermobifida alba]|uniref:Tetratricopeptide repeat protein n=2 Tax=Thermobifida alba TaxID=53522 RepID=A0ABY4L332_THEAE|nr:tetratricopeptide repeat protein [Thermobifida alba]
MVTITGAAGAGKSRLASALYTDVSGEFEDGGCFLVLDGARSREELLQTLIGALRTGDADTADTPLECLAEYLGKRHFLLVLDGCDELLESLPTVLVSLVAACPRLTVLVTVCEPLGIYGEDLFRLAPLAVPDPEGDSDLAELEKVASVRLFIQRTRAVRPGFALTTENRHAVAQLCVRTDGLPLAIELAAARMKLSSPQALLESLDRDLDVLSVAGSNTLSRHSCMRSAITWHLLRLHPADQEFLGRVAAFHAGFDLPAARGVGGVGEAETQRRLEQLIDKNLLHVGECPDGDITFQMAGLTRQYVLEWLRETGRYTEVLRGHADYMLSMSESVRDELTGPEQAHHLSRLDQWHTDLEKALRFLNDNGDEAGAVRLVCALRSYWQAVGRSRTGARFLEKALDTAELPTEVRIEGAATLGELKTVMGEYDEAHRHLVHALRGYRQAGDTAAEASCRKGLGTLAYHRGDLDQAARLLEESATALRKAGDTVAHAAALRDLAECHLAGGDPAAARAPAETALRESTRRGDRRAVALANRVLADVEFAVGNQDRAERLHRTSLEELHSLGDRGSCATGLERFAVLLARRYGRVTKSWRRTARGLGAARALRAATGCAAPRPLAAVIEEVREQARIRLGDDAFDEEWRAGRSAGVHAVLAEMTAPLDLSITERQRRYGADVPLTQREIEVAELVARGMTNREIARRLGIAEWTAVNHLRKVMRKLDCSSRVHVASWVTRREREEQERAGS